METGGDLKELREEFKNKKKEVAVLRSQLLSKNREKETAYQKLRSLRDTIKSKTSKVKESKAERDSMTKEVKKLKITRDKLNTSVQEKSSTRKEVDQKKKALLDKNVVQDNPQKLKRDIVQIEEKLETEVMPYSKEQQLRKQLKEIKVAYAK